MTMAAGNGRLWADSIVAVFPHLRPSPGRWGVVRRPGKAGGASLCSSLDDDLRHAGRVSYQKSIPWERRGNASSNQSAKLRLQ